MTKYKLIVFKRIFTCTCILILFECTPKPDPFLLGILVLSQPTDSGVFQIISTVPATNQTGISRTAVLSITFNKNVDTTSLSGNISLTQPSPNAISTFSVKTTGGIITLTPSSNFTAASNYTITLRSGIKAITAESLGSDFLLTFTTE